MARFQCALNIKSFRFLVICFNTLFFILCVVYLFSQKSSFFKKDIVEDPHPSHWQYSVNDNSEYAVIIDAGSSGSRAYIYTWQPHDGDPKSLLNIFQLRDSLGRALVKKVEPGLSSFVDKPHLSASYMTPLLEFAAENVPYSKHRETPLFILATAGMRLLKKSDQESILEDLRENISKKFSFLFSQHHVEIISGVQEGIYLWIAANYITGFLDHRNEVSAHRKDTMGVLEMGGASLQVAFEVNNKTLDKMDERLKNHIIDLNLGCQDHDTTHLYHIFVATYLGLGANIVQDAHLSHMLKESHDISQNTLVIKDPCFPLGFTEAVNITHPNSSKPFPVVVKGLGDLDECQKKLAPLLNSSLCLKNSACPLIHPLLKYKQGNLFGFSEFWFTMDDILGLGGHYRENKFTTNAQNYCSTKWSVLKDRYIRKLYPRSDWNRLRNQCFKSAWLKEVLHSGLELPHNYEGFQSLNNFKDQSVQWTLGALLYRTRYFPLRSLPPGAGSYFRTPWSLHPTVLQIILVIFILVMGVVILFLLRRLFKSFRFYYKASDPLLPIYTNSLPTNFIPRNL